MVDSATGRVLYDRNGTAGTTPASLSKLLTGAAVLVHRDPAERLRTRVVVGRRPGELVLVGAGDATLASTRRPRDGYPPQADLATLAQRTALAVRGRRGPLRVSVDDSLFGAERVSRAWRSTYVSGGVVAPVSALSVDQGRVRPGFSARVRDPAIEAGRRLRALLEARGVRVRDKVVRVRRALPQQAPELAAVESAPLSVQVEMMLRTSDNDLAEALWRLAAVGAGRPPTFAGGSAAARAALAELHVSASGARPVDGSGLSRSSRVPPRVLAQLLRTAGTEDAAQLRPLLSGLPAAGFEGTLAQRFTLSPASSAVGEVRAKTGTLTGVSGLAGVALTDDGRLLVLVLMADRIRPQDTLDARAALDAGAAALAECGCR